MESTIIYPIMMKILKYLLAISGGIILSGILSNFGIVICIILILFVMVIILLLTNTRSFRITVEQRLRKIKSHAPAA